MSNRNLIFATAGQAGAESDDDFASTVLLLHGDGTNGAQNNTILDSSTNNFTITRNGNTTQGSFSPFSKPDGAWGNYFEGTASYLSLSGNSAFAIATSTTPFTVEAWVYPTASAGGIFNEVYTGGANTVSIGFCLGTGVGSTDGLKPWLGFYNGSSWNGTISDNAVALNEWSHVAAVFTGSGIQIYINGVQQTTTTTGTVSTWQTFGTNGDGWYVGRRWDATSPSFFSGYISNFRFVNGSAVYSSGFTPSTTPLTTIANTALLTCQSNRFVDNSPNGLGITANGNTSTVKHPSTTPFSPFPITTAYDPSINGGSAYADSSGDNLRPSFTLSLTGEFSFEIWAYIQQTGQRFIASFNTNVYGSIRLTQDYANSPNSNRFEFSTNGSSFAFTQGVTMPYNSWTHLVATRDSSNRIRVFVNGVLVGSAVVSGTMYSAENNHYLADAMNGWISGAHLVVGSVPVQYQTASTTNGAAIFSVPSSPPVPVANTSLLCNFTNAGIYDNTGFNVLESVGNCQISTTTKKYGTGSLSFDGTGDSLLIPSSENLAFGTGSWTVEFWLYPNDVSGLEGLVTIGAFRFFKNDAGLWFLVSSSSIANVGSVLTASTWQHIALVKVAGAGTPITIYVDGVSVATGNDGATNYTAAACYIGSEGAGSYLNSLIDDLRITKGIARYTAAFTPPTKAFPNIGA